MTWHPDIPLHYRDQIVTGDARALARDIPDASVDLVFTDPVYERIEDYEWLAREAARMLKPDCALLTFCGIGYMPKTLDALRQGGARYRWTLGTFQPNGPSRRATGEMFSKWYACVWCDFGDTQCFASFPDMAVSLYEPQSGHQWRKSPHPFLTWLTAFSSPGALVYDPFCGGGTIPAVCKMLNRHYIASEIDPATAERARERVLNTQPPLEGLVVEQLALEAP